MKRKSPSSKPALLREWSTKTSGPRRRVVHEDEWSTKTSWSSSRRVIAKANHLAKGANPRFVVTNLPFAEFDARTTYEDKYSARGKMENRIKEQQPCLFTDRASCATMQANQLRLWFSTLAYLLMAVLCEQGLKGTELATARCDTLQTKLLKIGAVVTVTFRKIWLHLSSACPFRTLFERVLADPYFRQAAHWLNSFVRTSRRNSFQISISLRTPVSPGEPREDRS